MSVIYGQCYFIFPCPLSSPFQLNCSGMGPTDARVPFPPFQITVSQMFVSSLSHACHTFKISVLSPTFLFKCASFPSLFLASFSSWFEWGVHNIQPISGSRADHGNEGWLHTRWALAITTTLSTVCSCFFSLRARWLPANLKYQPF